MSCNQCNNPYTGCSQCNSCAETVDSCDCPTKDVSTDCSVYTGDDLESALSRNVGEKFYGCSTSGEIVPQGYRENTLSAISFDRSTFSSVSRKIENVKEFGFQHARDLVLSMQQELRESIPDSNSSNTFALLLIDSMSQAEEFVAAARVGAAISWAIL